MTTNLFDHSAFDSCGRISLVSCNFLYIYSHAAVVVLSTGQYGAVMGSQSTIIDHHSFNID